MTNETADTSVKTVEELTAALEKAEAKIVSLKKAEKAGADKAENVEEKTTEEKEEKTVNEETSIQEQIDAAVKSALEERQIEENNSISNSMSIDGENSSSSFNVLSVNEYDSLSVAKQEEYLNSSLKEYGELELTMG